MMSAVHLKALRPVLAAGTTVENGGCPQGGPEGSWI